MLGGIKIWIKGGQYIHNNGKLYVVNQKQSLEDKEREEELKLIKKEVPPDLHYLFMK